MAADATRLLPDEESQLSEGLRHHEGDEDRLGRCRRCGRSCGGCCRFLWFRLASVRTFYLVYRLPRFLIALFLLLTFF